MLEYIKKSRFKLAALTFSLSFVILSLPLFEQTGENSISTPALMMTTEIMAPKIPSEETFHRSMTPAETSVARVMMESNRASEPEVIKASLFNYMLHDFFRTIWRIGKKDVNLQRPFRTKKNNEL